MLKKDILARITGPVVMIGFGSIGRGTLPLLERHFDYDRNRLVVIDPDGSNRSLLDEQGIRFMEVAVTPDNYKSLLEGLLTEGSGQGFCVNLSVDTSSLDIMKFCRSLGALYIDTVIEPWPGFYTDTKVDAAARSNYSLRERLLSEKRSHSGANGGFLLRCQPRHGLLVR